VPLVIWIDGKFGAARDYPRFLGPAGSPLAAIRTEHTDDIPFMKRNVEEGLLLEVGVLLVFPREVFDSEGLSPAENAASQGGNLILKSG